VSSNMVLVLIKMEQRSISITMLDCLFVIVSEKSLCLQKMTDFCYMKSCTDCVVDTFLKF